MKPKNWFESLNCAIEGILYTVKTERHMKVHFIVSAVVILLSLTLDINRVEFVLLTVSITLVLFAEIMNTALEVVVDMVQSEYHPLAKRAKDIAAGGVLVASVGAVVMGYMIFSKPVFDAMTGSLQVVKQAPEYLTIIALIIVVIAVVMMKSHFEKGTPLYGGMPSGHAAVSFSVWTSVALITMDPFITILTFILALMVSHSRLLLGIHSKWEVAAGGLLGFLITLLIFQIFV